MARKYVRCHFFRVLACGWFAIAGLSAAEHHGIVKSAGLPIPGATVTAIKGDQKVVTTTDDRGAYNFPNLEDGTWTIEVNMLGFTTVTREVAVSAMAPSPEWELKVLSADALRAQAQASHTKNSPA